MDGYGGDKKLLESFTRPAGYSDSNSEQQATAPFTLAWFCSGQKKMMTFQLTLNLAAHLTQ
jgi:hypothetical protein